MIDGQQKVALHLYFLPSLPVTSIPPFIFPSITHCRRQEEDVESYWMTLRKGEDTLI
jgi:hypothetical protein